MTSTAVNNEFFTKACHEWTERLSEGEFTPENQQKIKLEEEREHAKLDPWKVRQMYKNEKSFKTNLYEKIGLGSMYIIVSHCYMVLLSAPL